MKGFRGTVIKEMLLLIRDIPGMAILFIMPMVLILVITLTQENAFKSITGSRPDIILINNDKKDLGNKIEKGLKESGYFNVVSEVNGKELTSEDAERMIALGDYQAGIIVPQGSTEKAEMIADKIIRAAYDSAKNTGGPQESFGQIDLSFDPAIRDAYKYSVTSSLKRLVQAIEFQMLLKRFFVILPDRLNEKTKAPVKKELIRQLGLMEDELNRTLKQRMGEYFPKDLKIEAPDKDPDIDLRQEFSSNLEFNFSADSENLVSIKESYASNEGSKLQPTLVQNNVPAFALFAMFFIVIPLAGSLITERNQGTYNRLRTLPVKYITMLAGKTFIYTLVCLSQLGIMILTGIFLIPLVSGLPALEMGSSYVAVFITAVSCALSAIGFGLLVGTFSSTHSQAGMFGSFMVVILGILGGIFLPVYMMPEPLRIFTMLSPVRWGTDSFLDLFVRNGNISTIWPNIIRLNLFFAFALIVAMLNFVKRK